MAYSPSTRIKGEEEGELNLNLNPMMDMFAVLIPALLMMSVVVEVTIINVSAPSIGPSTGGQEQQPPDKPPLNLKVTILDSGYLIGTSMGMVPGADGTPSDVKKPTIPVIENTILCSKFRGTRPPPRARNTDRPICDPKQPLDKKTFWIYDTKALAAKMLEIKNANPTEHRIIIAGGPEVEYEAIIDVMDASRDFQESNGEITTLFDEVVLSPGL